MRSRRSTRTSRAGADRRAGISLIELLVTVGLTGVVLASVVNFMSIQSRKLRGHQFRLETQHALRASLDAITRDLRLAGACLPDRGAFVALAGTNGPTDDEITARSGVVRTNLSCVVTALTAPAAQGATSVTVADASGFAADTFAYIANDVTGEFVEISGVAGNTVTFSPGLTQAFAATAGLHAVDERRYRIDRSDPDNPVLTLTVNRGEEQEFAAGVTDLEVRYVLAQNCPPCDVVDAPDATDTVTWRLVNELILDMEARTIGTTLAEDEVTLAAQSRAKPRNLLP
jgi:Tfp pilus assembly protein PilW